jgi:hypothetical protein
VGVLQLFIPVRVLLFVGVLQLFIPVRVLLFVGVHQFGSASVSHWISVSVSINKNRNSSGPLNVKFIELFN